MTPGAQPPAPSPDEHPAPSPASPEPAPDRAGRHGAELVARAGDIMKRRRLRLIAIAVPAGFFAAIAGAVWTWLLPPSGGLRASAGFVIGLWVALVVAGTTLAVLADQRPGWFWTFAVSHGPQGADCPGCAVLDYFGDGPLGLGLTTDPWKFDELLCAERRTQLRHQAQQIRQTMDSVIADAKTGYYQAEAEDTVNSEVDNGSRATVAPHVYLVYMTRDQNDQPQRWPIDAGRWAFHVVHRDGWQVCQVDTPNICREIVICDPADRRPIPSPSASTPADPLDPGQWESRQPCAPLDPLRQLHNCPSNSSSQGTQRSETSSTPVPTPTSIGTSY